ncbi:MAG: ATP synthase F1 subunit delta [Kiritimatiellae bacterium]|jgi:F-type H+-transporting ATPase subunit delta|nr:ATP synthase F1 subunit delta [Kiritimatiellia bacterium]
MLDAGLARRYARALLNSVSKGENVEKTASDLHLVLQTCAASGELRVFLNSPVVPLPAKQKIIKAIFAGKIEGLTGDFLELLLEKQRFNLLSGISGALESLIDEMRGRTRVGIVSALPVDKGERAYLLARLEKWLRQSVLLEVKTDPALLSGIQVRVGDRVYDGSGQGRLAQIRAVLQAS